MSPHCMPGLLARVRAAALAVWSYVYPPSPYRCYACGQNWLSTWWVNGCDVGKKCLVCGRTWRDR